MKNKSGICGRSIEDFLEIIEGFHGWKAPGVVIGGFMVDLARELVGPHLESDVVVETFHCLPDAVQLLTPCTFGNGWMKVLDWDKYALSLYEKKTLLGARVWLDLEKTRLFPHIFDWYMRRVPKKALPLDVLLDSILAAGRDILSHAPVRVTQYYGKKQKGRISVCPKCREAYPVNQGSQCQACGGRGYYDRLN
jgi:formylmethanofuran dehydrogenase subunit E